MDVSSSSLDKLPIFAQFGVRDAWRHDGERATILVFQGDSYAEAEAS